ncbi:hypothetical protein TIFTF001_032414 [Ficus carica]|uniref:Uncharacterized protein n=1 Tax=Ficus carica TaxID=3494 RepID=A0AA88E3F5_FICCA|nr:hypothetical protein TIFTF001_032414 [Ficus carica]
MMASKLSCVVPTCHEGGFGPWFELDWTGRPNHSMAARHERKLMTYVYAVVGFDVHYRDPEIYADMHRRRYASYVAAWRAYPNESMGHYCQRFRDAMLSYTPLGTHMVQTLSILRGGLPPEIMRFTPIATPEMTLDEMIGAIMDAEILAH